MLSATTIFNPNYWLDLAKAEYYTRGGELQEASASLTQEKGAFRESELIEKLAVRGVATGRNYTELKTAIDAAIRYTKKTNSS